MLATAVSLQPTYAFEYSICTLVTDAAEYEGMVEAFVGQGFGTGDCEYLFIDNTRGNQLDAFAGNNRLLSAARGRYVVLCHQDVVPMYDDRARMDALLAELTGLDAAWGVCGNAGVTSAGEHAVHITDPYGADRVRGGPFPQRVTSLDENLLVIRAEANLGFSRDISGFHWSGSDVCILADIQGWHAYVIDFHLRHNSGGTVGTAFQAARDRLVRKYARAFRPRWHHTVTDATIYLASRSDSLLISRAFRKLARKLGRDLG